MGNLNDCIAVLKFVYSDPDVEKKFQSVYLAVDNDGKMCISLGIHNAWVMNPDRADELAAQYANDPGGTSITFGVGLIPDSRPQLGSFVVVKYRREE